MKKSVVILIGVLFSIVLIAAVGTTIDDFFMPGSQPGDSGNIEHPDKCDNCHGGYDLAVEPAFNWRGSMMAQAARDPLFYACLAIANQDAPESGDLCIRCHAPDGWLNGRSTPTDGSALNNNDREGVQCDFCHKLVKPSEIGVNPFLNDDDYTAGTYSSDQNYLGSIIMIPPQSGNGMYVAHDANAKRGPFVDADAKHQMLYSPFHSQSDICGTCHDVSSPAIDVDGALTTGGITKKLDAFKTYNMLPIERTFSEWKVSEYAVTGVTGTPFGGNKSSVSTCQDCHMRDVTGYGCNKRGVKLRPDLPLHDMTGGNTFIPGLVAQLYPDEVNTAALDAGKDRALFMLQNAATMNLSVTEQSDGEFLAEVEVFNETGHKLPSGYPEGRRIWINLQATDASGNTVFESGAYDLGTAELTKDQDIKIYEIKMGMTEAVASLANANNPYSYTYEAGESFHFVLNNEVIKDNRIPPRGFTNSAFESIHSPVVDYAYADGAYSDKTQYTLPISTVQVKATLYYQTVSKEYIEFLRDMNETNDAGTILYDLWDKNGKSAPVVMTTKTVTTGTTINPPVADFSAAPLSGQAPLTVDFTDLSTNQPVTWNWSFGDGNTSTEQNPSHTYASAGTYDVSLTVSNGGGDDTKTVSGYITVTAQTNDQPISVTSVVFNEQILNGGRTSVTAQITLSEPVDGALVTAAFTTPKNSVVSGTTSNGVVTFESQAIKGSATWCIDVTDIILSGYVFVPGDPWCSNGTQAAAKSAALASEAEIIHSNGADLRVYPSPFNDKLRFEFNSPEDTYAKIDLYDITGRQVQTVFDQNIEGGTIYNAEFKPVDEVSAIYFYRMRLGDDIINGKVVYKKE